MTIEIANAVCRFAIDIPTEVLLYRSFACAMSLAIHNFVGTNDWVLLVKEELVDEEAAAASADETQPIFVYS
jgi:hypothetical protein